jgi:hypothetical protein
MEKFQEFEVWLKEKNQLNWRDNINSMITIEKILLVPNFEKISSLPILNQLLGALRNNVSFASKSKIEKDKEIKSFKLYIQYKEDERQQKTS